MRWFSFICGFMFPASIIGVAALFIWLMMKWEVSRVDFAIGAASCMAVLIFGFLIAVKIHP
jgi:putative effector of murein hydrolase LrgA (UPF0299 family)